MRIMKKQLALSSKKKEKKTRSRTESVLIQAAIYNGVHDSSDSGFNNSSTVVSLCI